MRQLSIFFVSTLALTLVACGASGGGDDDDDTSPDANTAPTIDAMPQPIDGPPAATGTLGTACTPDAANPMGQGDCAAGFQCLSLQGATGAWCTKTCTGPADTSCDTGFNAPGLGYCYLQVDFDGAGGEAPVNYCGVICNDTGAGVCTDCNDTCPNNYLQCTAALTDMGGNTVAEGCQ